MVRTMTAPSRPRRGRPRSPEADRAILDATRSALVELGWRKVTMGLIAERAGVAKTTLYRRWASKSELVVDAVSVVFDELHLPDSGSLRTDIEDVVLAFAELLRRPEAKSALMAVVAEATTEPVLRAKIKEILVGRQKRLVVLGRQRAQARGELPPDPGGPEQASRAVDLIFDVIAGAVVHRSLISTEPIDREWAQRFTNLLLGGLPATSE
ncbi:TetR/AcrR family transcriptional regulator [Streptomyces sulphureus]|uniref:TetR/AcrR family transcriptional regulator n=1 Tax=Streptomyces sulphureus TaxID=47758 RepID=UPI00038224F7|nr:TetR/AcrR family transcriptional regulator [Streptomyces sulphureus]